MKWSSGDEYPVHRSIFCSEVIDDLNMLSVHQLNTYGSQKKIIVWKGKAVNLHMQRVPACDLPTIFALTHFQRFHNRVEYGLQNRASNNEILGDEDSRSNSDADAGGMGGVW